MERTSNTEQIGPKCAPPSLLESCPPEPLVPKPRAVDNSCTQDKEHCVSPQSLLYTWLGEVSGTARALAKGRGLLVPGTWILRGMKETRL